MYAGLGLLRLEPSAFWRMTPREFAAACGASGRRPSTAPKRSELQSLMQRYPDGGQYGR